MDVLWMLHDVHPLIEALLILLIHSPWSVGALGKMDPLDTFVPQAVHDPKARKKIWEEQPRGGGFFWGKKSRSALFLPRFKHVVNLFE
jgi:hypothetical protein